MLYESQMIFDDQVASLKKDSQKHGTQGEEIDFALEKVKDLTTISV